MRLSDALVAVVVLLVGWSFYRAQRNPEFLFDAFDLIMENGRVSRLACVFVGSFACLTWIMVRLTMDGKMTEGYMGAYGAMWVAPIIAKLFAAPAIDAPPK